MILKDKADAFVPKTSLLILIETERILASDPDFTAAGTIMENEILSRTTISSDGVL
jgi:hypothetical protein